MRSRRAWTAARRRRFCWALPTGWSPWMGTTCTRRKNSVPSACRSAWASAPIWSSPCHQAGAVQLVDSQLKGQPSLFERFFPASSPTETVTIGDGELPEPVDPQSLPLFDPTTYGMAAADPVMAGPFEATFPVVLDKGPGFR